MTFKLSYIQVEDPFEQPANAARGVSSKQLTRIEEAFRRTHFMLISSNQNQNEVISTLVKPHVSKFVARTPAGNQNNYSRNGLRPQVQAQRAILPPMRAQHQLYAQRAVLPPIRAQIQLQAQRTMQSPIQAPHQLQAQRPIYPPFQAHRLQDKGLDRNQNSSAQRPTQANRVQTQPIWRPKSDT